MFEELDPFIISGAFIAVFVFYIIYRMRNKDSKSVDENNFSYVQKGDPNAQTIYDDKLKDKDPLTKDEKTELSWQFLYDITDIVLNKFTPEDKNAVEDLGKKLVDSGAGYEHVVEYGIKKEKKKSRLIEETDKSKGQVIGM